MKLRAKKPIQYKGKHHKPGDVFEYDELAGAKELCRQGHAEPVEDEPEGEKDPGEDK